MVAPAEEVLGRTCKTCKTFCELTDFKGKRKKVLNDGEQAQCIAPNVSIQEVGLTLTAHVGT